MFTTEFKGLDLKYASRHQKIYVPFEDPVISDGILIMYYS